MLIGLRACVWFLQYAFALLLALLCDITASVCLGRWGTIITHHMETTGTPTLTWRVINIISATSRHAKNDTVHTTTIVGATEHETT